MTEFSYEKKIKLRDKIQKVVKSKEDLLGIKALLKSCNPELEMSKNKNGYFIDILNLELSTYIELAKYIDKLDKKRIEEEKQNSLSDNTKSDSHVESTENVENVEKKPKYKNSENHILNRAKYEKALKEYQEEEKEEEQPPTQTKTDVFKKRVNNK